MWFKVSVKEKHARLPLQPYTLNQVNKPTSDPNRFLSILKVREKQPTFVSEQNLSYNLCENQCYTEKHVMQICENNCLAEECLLNCLHTFHTLPHVRAKDHVIGTGASVFWGVFIHLWSWEAQILTASIHIIPFFTPVCTCTANQKVKGHAKKTNVDVFCQNRWF